MNMQPSIIGSRGKAYNLKPFDTNPLCIGKWFINAPSYHPIFPSYGIILISLEHRADTEAPVIKLPGATHEIIVASVDPAWRFTTANPKLPIMQPINFAGQFIAESHEAATRRAIESVIMVCNGNLNPDSDGLLGWASLYGDALVNKNAPAQQIIETEDGKVVIGTGAKNIRKIMGDNDAASHGAN